MTEPTADTRAPVTGVVGLGSVGEALLHLLFAAGHRVVAVDTDLDVLARAALLRSWWRSPTRAGSTSR